VAVNLAKQEFTILLSNYGKMRQILRVSLPEKTSHLDRPVRKDREREENLPVPREYGLRLYSSGFTRRSLAAVDIAQRIGDYYLSGRYELTAIDLAAEPHRAQEHHILATPTLVKEFPLPPRRHVDDLSNVATVLRSLEIPPSVPEVSK